MDPSNCIYWVGWWAMWKGNGEVFQKSISIEDETNSYFNFR